MTQQNAYLKPPHKDLSRIAHDAVCKCRANTTVDYSIVVFYTGWISLHMCLLCNEDESSFATDSGKLRIGHQQYPLYEQRHPALVFSGIAVI